MPPLHVNAVIFGAGAAGLWTLDAVRRTGRSALVLEATALGDGQTISSQGIIHSGLKYSLHGLLTSAAKEARDAVETWKQCFAGKGVPDLSGVKILSPACYLWGTDSAASKIGMLGARIGLRSTPQNVPPAERPAALAKCSGAVYRIDEEVLSPQSLLENLAAPNRDAIFHYDAASPIEFDQSAPGDMQAVTITSPGGVEKLTVAADYFMFTAGNGNAELRSRAGFPSEKMQRRPLHVALARGPLPDFYGHCIEGAKTRITVTSGRDAEGRTVWQIAGNLAEDSINIDREALIRAAQTDVAETLPAVDLHGTEWTTFRIDRAEGATLTGGRPDSFKLFTDGNVLTAWPTKLVLVPKLADELTKFVAQTEPRPASFAELNAAWPHPTVAPPHWDRPQTWIPYVAR